MGSSTEEDDVAADTIMKMDGCYFINNIFLVYLCTKVTMCIYRYIAPTVLFGVLGK
jgi:hypothetical protein